MGDQGGGNSGGNAKRLCGIVSLVQFEPTDRTGEARVRMEFVARMLSPRSAGDTLEGAVAWWSVSEGSQESVLPAPLARIPCTLDIRDFETRSWRTPVSGADVNDLEVALV